MDNNDFTKIAKTTTDGMMTSGSAAIGGFQELAKAYQAMATKNTDRLTASMKELAGAKSPVEFVELQRKFLTDAFESAIADGGHIAKLTAEVFTSALHPQR